MNGKTKFMKAMRRSWCRRKCPRWYSYNQKEAHKYIGGRWPRVKSAPDPTLILWNNLGYSKTERCLRGSYVTVAALLLIAIGVGIITGLNLW